MKTAAAYIRVSDERQEEFSPDSQLKLIRAYCHDHELCLPEELIFCDDGISAKTSARRPQFLEMITLAKSENHPIDAIVVWKYSRFARNQEESIVFKSMLRRNGVEVLSVSEPIGNDPFGSLVERIIEWMDEYYLVRLSGEVRRGMTEKALRGQPNAAPPFGYLLSDGTPIPHPAESETVKFIFNSYIFGINPPQIAKILNDSGILTHKGHLFDTRAVTYILQNPIYAGYTRWSPNGRLASDRIFDKDRFIIAKGTHQPLIPEEDFVTANLLLSTVGKRELKHGGRAHLLRGLLRCALCGNAMVYHHAATPTYRCTAAAKGRCDMPTITVSSVNSAVLKEISRKFPTIPIFLSKSQRTTSTKSPQSALFTPLSATHPSKHSIFRHFEDHFPVSTKEILFSDFLYDPTYSEHEKNTALAVLIQRITVDARSRLISVTLNTIPDFSSLSAP